VSHFTERRARSATIGRGKVSIGFTYQRFGFDSIDGIDLYDLSVESLADFRREYIGFVFQQYHLIPYLTVLENILAPEAAQAKGNNQRRGRELAEQFGLAHRLEHTPGELSAGEKQRTALARALLFEPKVILADEITGNLDDENAQIVLGYLREYVRAGGSVLLVTHDREIAGQADRVHHLAQGKESEVAQ